MITTTILDGQPVPADVIWTPEWELQLKNEVRYSDTPYVIHTPEGNYIVTINPDQDAEDPREWDNLGTMVYWHRRYKLGDVDGSKDYSSTDEFLEEARKGKYIMLPLGLLDHSGITMYVGGHAHFQDPGGWDSGQVGWIYITPEKAKEEYDWKIITKARREQVLSYLRLEVQTFDDFITGSVYCYDVEHEDGENVDSCCGYYGDFENSGILDEIKFAIAADIKSRQKKREESHKSQSQRLKQYIKHKVPLNKRKSFIY